MNKSTLGIVIAVLSVISTVALTAKEVFHAYAESSHVQYIQCAIDLALLGLVILGFCVGWHFLRSLMIKRLEDKAALPGIIDKHVNPKLKTIDITIDALKNTEEAKHKALQSHVVYNQRLLRTLFNKIVGSVAPPAPDDN